MSVSSPKPEGLQEELKPAGKHAAVLSPACCTCPEPSSQEPFPCAVQPVSARRWSQNERFRRRSCHLLDTHPARLGSARSSRLGPGGRRALLREDNFSTAPAPGALPTPLQPRSTAPRPEAEPNSLPAARAPPAEAPDPQLRLAPGCGLGPGGGSAPAAPAPPRHAAAVGSRRPLPALGLRGLREARRRPGAARWAAC